MGLGDLGEADPRPYVRLAARLRRQILDGEVAPGQRVPSITTLSQESGPRASDV
jgi:DNA-binding GntR family transcriptional regulator